jgi:hypothetical protein
MFGITKRIVVPFALVVSVLASGSTADAAVPGVATDATGNSFIAHIGQFLDSCPASDPATAQIRSDFQIRRNGIVVGAIGCTAPAAQLPIAQFSDELIVLQGLRVMYYMDRGRSGHLPWTPGSLYDWIKSQVQGIDIRDDATSAYCCYQVDGKMFFVVNAQDEVQRNFDRSWESLSGNIGLYTHEARHVAGYPHAACGDPPGSFDQVYDQNNLSAYATNYWLNKLWLTGEINVGFACLPPDAAQRARDWHDSAANSTFRFRYCDNVPPLVPVPAIPGGPCRAGIPAWAPYTAYAVDVQVVFNGRIYVASQAHTSLPDWSPTRATTLWYLPTPSAGAPWETQTRYLVGSEVTFNGSRYRALMAHVAQPNWTPPVSPTLWKKL